MPGTAMEVDVCVCFSNNCNGKKSSIGEADEEKESSHGEMIHYLENKVTIVDFANAQGPKGPAGFETLPIPGFL